MAFGCHDLHHLSSVCLPIVLSLRSSVPRWFDFQPLEKRHKSQFYAHFLMLIGQCDRAAASYAGLWFGATLNISIRSYCRIGNDLMWVRPFSTWLETQIHFSASTDALPLIWRWDPFVAAILTHAIHSAKHLIQPSDNWLKSKWLWFLGYGQLCRFDRLLPVAATRSKSSQNYFYFDTGCQLLLLHSGRLILFSISNFFGLQSHVEKFIINWIQPFQIIKLYLSIVTWLCC